ncbi:MAG TPA: RDD family protein [Thermoleophilaceae bacterium]
MRSGEIAFYALTALPLALTAVIVARAWRGRDDIAEDVNPGGWAERSLAWLIDVALPALVALSIEVFARYGIDLVGADRDWRVVDSWAVPIVIGLWILNFGVLQALTGRTVGKQLVGLRTLRRGGGLPPLWATLVRTVTVFPLFGA